MSKQIFAILPYNNLTFVLTMACNGSCGIDLWSKQVSMGNPMLLTSFTLRFKSINGLWAVILTQPYFTISGYMMITVIGTE